jgi:hypothetical protein
VKVGNTCGGVLVNFGEGRGRLKNLGWQVVGEGGERERKWEEEDAARHEPTASAQL